MPGFYEFFCGGMARAGLEPEWRCLFANDIDERKGAHIAEAARLMGLPHSYVLPSRPADAFHPAGDGVATPNVRFLSENLLLPLVSRRGACDLPLRAKSV